VSVELHHRLDGPEDAPVLVLGNSLGTTIDLWDDQVPALSVHFRVLRYDLRGHGRSPVPPGPYAIEDFGSDLVVLLDRLSLKRVSMCGLSIGGMTAMWLASARPERVDRLALCCTAAYMGPPEPWLDRAAVVRQHGTAAVADAAVERWFTAEGASRHPEAVARMRHALERTPAEGYAAGCEAIATLDLRDRLAAIRAPTLVVSGAEDPAAPPAAGRLIADAVPGARQVVVPGAHLANLEQPELVSEALVEHLTAEVRA